MKPRFAARISLRTRFALGLGAVLLPFSLAAAVGVFYLLPGLIGPLEEIEKVAGNLELVHHLQVALLTAATPVKDYLINADPSERTQFAKLGRPVERDFEKIRTARFGHAQKQALVESAEKEWLRARELGESLLRLRRPVGDPQAAGEMKRFDARVDHAVALLDEVHEVIHKQIEVSRSAARAARSRSLWATFAAFVLALAISFYAGIALARSVVTGVETLRHSAARLAQGDLSHRAPAGRRDEFGELAAAFNATAEALEGNRASIERHAVRLGALNHIAATINSSLQLGEIQDEIMRRGIALTGGKAACIALYDEAAERFTDWVTQGFSEHFVRNMSFRPGGLADEAFTHGSYVLSNDRPESKHKLSRLAREEGLKCFISLPLTSRDHRLGVMYLYHADRDTFTPAEIELLQTFASLAAQAIENARLYALAQGQASTDALTGAFNRLRFNVELAKEMARSARYKTPLALVMYDIDCFKAINDAHGHQAGDRVLVGITRLTAGHIRQTDLLARWGGEEFMILAPNCGGQEAVRLAEKLRQLINESVFDEVGTVTCSFGVAWFQDGDTAETITSRVDDALYAAKRGGRNRTCLFGPEQSVENRE